MELFPIIQPEAAAGAGLSLYKEVAWDYEQGRPIFKEGSPVFVTGKDAVKVWIWKALVTNRKRYAIYDWDFGNDAETLIGQDFASSTKQAEAARYIREALEINPYITDIGGIKVDFSDSTLTIEATVTTVYGEVDIVV